LILLILSSQSDVFMIIFFVFLGILGVTIMILLLFMFLPFSNQKLLYDTVCKEVIKDINYNEDISIECETLTKNKDYIADGGLFTKYASVQNKYQLQFLNREGHQVSMADTTIITSSDKSTTIHFDGTYFVFKIDNRNIFQLRANSSPKLSKTRFNKISTWDDVKEYVEEDGNQSISTRYYTLYDFLKGEFPNQKVYIGGVEKEIHVAIWLDKKRVKYPKLSADDIETIRGQLMGKIKLSEEIYNIISV